MYTPNHFGVCMWYVPTLAYLWYLVCRYHTTPRHPRRLSIHWTWHPSPSHDAIDAARSRRPQREFAPARDASPSDTAPSHVSETIGRGGMGTKQLAVLPGRYVAPIQTTLMLDWRSNGATQMSGKMRDP